ncbi:MAG TPA: hypothetical protein PLW97_12640, partial [Synergistaceae bacterium]|nr:hypothetical protein [Synergistaceae bacterium]
LKKDSRGYDLLLELLSLEDREFLEAFVQYPNGASFLLNTGNEGIRLLEESDGEILALSCFLSHKEQRALPELCSRYPQLPKVLGASGFEAYFVVMVDPDFFFNLARAISGSEESKYLLAHAVLSRQMEAWKDPQELGKFLSSLSREQKDCLAFYVADFLDRFESSMEDEEAALPLAPLFDPYFFRFVHAYGERAVRLSQRFGDILPLGQIMMEDWRGEIRDITPVLDAIQDFDEMGLQAALEFRFNERMQDLVLGSLSGDRKRDSLMFLFYADSDPDSRDLSKNMGDWEKIMKKLLLEYKAEEHTGRPVPLEGGMEVVEFVPGYDIVKVIHDALAYGQTPTFGAITFAALDLVELVPIAWGTTTIVKNVAQQGVKASALRYAKQHALRSAKSALQKTTGLLDDAALSVKKMSLSDIRRRGRSLIRGVQNLPGLMGRGTLQARDACVIIIKASSSVKIQDIKSLFSYMGDLAKASGRTLGNLYGKTERYLTGLSSRPWMVRHATEAVMNGTVVEMLVQPTMFYFGALGIMDILEDRQQLQQLIQERHEAQRIY